MRKRKETIFDTLMIVPWWVSVIFSAIVYAGCSFILPAMLDDIPILNEVVKLLISIAPYLAFFFLIPAPISAVNSWRKRKLLDNQRNIQTIRSLRWKEFEELVGEYYRRKGYRVIENQGAGADGGVDVKLEKDGYIHLVQCKQWKSQKVGVSVVREMFGVMTAENASSVIIISSGHFTQEAINFAHGKPIELINGAKLEAMILGGIRTTHSTVDYEQEEISGTNDAPICPHCNSPLVLRTARKGANAGGQFYGCSSYPKCRYTEKYSD